MDVPLAMWMAWGAAEGGWRLILDPDLEAQVRRNMSPIGVGSMTRIRGKVCRMSRAETQRFGNGGEYACGCPVPLGDIVVALLPLPRDKPLVCACRPDCCRAVGALLVSRFTSVEAALFGLAWIIARSFLGA